MSVERSLPHQNATLEFDDGHPAQDPSKDGGRIYFGCSTKEPRENRPLQL